jgi:hypothetical protein
MVEYRPALAGLDYIGARVVVDAVKDALARRSRFLDSD